MLFADVVATSAALGETRSRRTKIDTLARLLGELDVAEIVPVVAWLAGAPRQGRTGIGWRTLAAVRGEPAESATLTVGDVDRTLSDVVETTGSGSTLRRRELLAAVLGASTAAEQDFLFRLLTGDLRQGALEGVSATGCGPRSPRGGESPRTA